AMRLIFNDPVAHWLIVAAAVVVVVGEVVATFLGHRRDGKRQARRSLMDSLRLYLQSRGAAMRQDRGTRLIVTLALYLGIFAALAIATVSGLRDPAHNQWTPGCGVR